MGQERFELLREQGCLERELEESTQRLEALEEQLRGSQQVERYNDLNNHIQMHRSDHQRLLTAREQIAANLASATREISSLEELQKERLKAEECIRSLCKAVGIQYSGVAKRNRMSLVLQGVGQRYEKAENMQIAS